MSRRLPPSITADKSPDWLPAGWIAETKVLKRGREVRTYTQLNTGKKFNTKDHVLHYVAMENVRQKRYAKHRRNKDLEWLPENWIMEERTCNKGSDMERTYKVYIDLLTGRTYLSKAEVLQHFTGLEHEASPNSSTWEEAVIDEYNNSCQRYPGYEEHENLPQNQEEPNASCSSDPLRRNKDLEWLPENWIVEERIFNKGAGVQRKSKVYTDLSTGRRYYSKAEALQHLASLECEASLETSEEAEIDEDNNSYQRMITYPEYEEHEDSPESQEEPNAGSPSRLLRRSKRLKLKSPSARRQLFAGSDEEISSPSDSIILESKGTTEEDQDQTDCSEGFLALSEDVLHDVVVESADQTMEKSDLTASSGFEVKLECEPVNVSALFGTDISPKKELTERGVEGMNARNVELTSNWAPNDKETNLTCRSDSAKDEVTEQCRDKSKEPPLKVQNLNEEQPPSEETVNESRKLLFFPFRGASSDAQHLRTSVTPDTFSAEDLNNCDGLVTTHIMEEKNIRGNKMQRKSTTTYYSKRMKKRNPKTPYCSTKQLEKSVKLQREKSNTSTAGNSPVNTGTSVFEGSSRNSKRNARQQTDNWPEPCPDFAFEPPTGPHRINIDDSVIHRFVEQHSAEGNSSLPDFGLPSLSRTKLSPAEADEQPAVVIKQSSPDPSCSQPTRESEFN